jgi:hypothetical protein
MANLTAIELDQHLNAHLYDGTLVEFVERDTLHRSDDDTNVLTFHSAVWDSSRMIINENGCPEGLTFHKFGSFKIEGDRVIAFNGNGYYMYCETPLEAVKVLIENLPQL